MKLIDKLLRKHKTEDDYFALYWHASAGIATLLVKVGTNRYYDLRNRDYVEGDQISYKESLTNYVKIDKEMITEREAKKYALDYYDKFSCNLNNLEDKYWARPYYHGLEM